MKHYKPSSELQREAEQSVRNTERLYRWAYKYLVLTGRYPETTPARQERHTNTNVIKFPARRGQIIGATLPEPPEAA